MVHVILDIDETLIHAVQCSKKQYEQSKSTPRGPNIRYVKVGSEHFRVYLRPYVHQFLRQVFGMSSSVSVWTAATRTYAYKMIQLLFKPTQIEKLRVVYHRRHTSSVNGGFYIKRLSNLIRKFSDMNLSNTFLVDDNMIHRLGNSDPSNIIRILKYNPKKESKEQSKLQYKTILSILRKKRKNLD